MRKKRMRTLRSRSEVRMRIFALLALAAMALGTVWVFAKGFGDLYDEPLGEAEKQAVLRFSEDSAGTANEDAEACKAMITSAYIAEVMSYERPYVPSESVSGVDKVNTLPSEENASQPVVVRYALSDEERDEVERVMMAECGGEERDGMIAVGQCILNACEESGLRPHEALKKYGYTHIRKEPSEAVKEAVCAVFDRGETVTDEPILYFYADYAKSPWHESQQFVMQIGVHRFFEKRGQGK